MNGAWSALLLGLSSVLAGCGRVGFQAIGGPPGDGVVGDAITVTVTSDEYLSEPAGLPIRDATVLYEHDGIVERATTDSTGAVTFPSAGVVAYHVVYRSEQGWRVYTIAPPRTAAIELGGRPAHNLDHRMTLTVPPGGTNDSLTAHLPDQCAILPLYGGTATFTFDFAPACEGRSVRMVAFRLRSGSGEYIDAGNVTLTNGTAYTVTGTYATVPSRTVQLTNLPIGTSYVGASLLLRSGIDLTRFSPNYDGVMTVDRSATVTTTAAPGGNALRVFATNDLPIQYSSSSERIAPATLATTTSFDGAAMLPLFTSLVLTHPPTVSWTGSGTAGTAIVVETITGGVQWDAYLDPSATSVTFPALPADLGVPTPTSFDFATVVKLDIPGASAASLAPALDRLWQEWPNDPALLPPEGSASARILYSIGLGPP